MSRSNRPQQIQGAVEASTSNGRRETERISSAGTTGRTRRRLLTCITTTDTVEQTSYELTYCVGELRHKKPERPASLGEERLPRANANPPTDRPSSPPLVPREVLGPAPSDANHPAAAPRQPSNLPVPQPDGVQRPCVAKLQESLFALDDICMQDGQIRTQVEEIGRLLAAIRRKETDVVQKVRDVQRTRVAVETLYTSRLKLDHSLVGQGERDLQDTEDGPAARAEPPSNRKRPAEESDAGEAEEEAEAPSAKRLRAEQGSVRSV
ncbi:hypothetical protein LXA43DRAFT_1039165 [Ganoderma leucocontextum]|nr:hypothetical protein LXA43DRAFT_1039165 [Ganoderma leucocontextum]